MSMKLLHVDSSQFNVAIDELDLRNVIYIYTLLLSKRLVDIMPSNSGAGDPNSVSLQITKCESVTLGVIFLNMRSFPRRKIDRICPGLFGV